MPSQLSISQYQTLNYPITPISQYSQSNTPWDSSVVHSSSSTCTLSPSDSVSKANSHKTTTTCSLWVWKYFVLGFKDIEVKNLCQENKGFIDAHTVNTKNYIPAVLCNKATKSGKDRIKKSMSLHLWEAHHIPPPFNISQQSTTSFCTNGKLSKASFSFFFFTSSTTP